MALKMSYRSAKKFKIAETNTSFNEKTTLDFSPKGNLLLTSSNNNILNIFDSIKGKKLNSADFGSSKISNSSFTHNESCVLFSSMKDEINLVSYYSFFDKKVIFDFGQIQKKVLCIDVSPVRDSFIMSEEGGIVRLFDFHSKKCSAIMKTNEPEPIVCYDPEGLIFAVGCSNSVVKLFDAREFSQGPFLSFSPETYRTNTVLISMEFSSNGKFIALRNNRNQIFVCDAFDGTLKQKLYIPESGIVTNPLEVGLKKQPEPRLNLSISGDDRLLSAGSEDGVFYIFDLDDRNNSTAPAKYFAGDLKPTWVGFNPFRNVLVTSTKDLTMWLPSGELQEPCSIPLKPVFDTSKEYELNVGKNLPEPTENFVFNRLGIGY